GCAPRSPRRARATGSRRLRRRCCCTALPPSSPRRLRPRSPGIRRPRRPAIRCRRDHDRFRTLELKTAMSGDEIDLHALSDDDLVQQMHQDLYDGLKEEIEQGVRILLERKWTPYDVLTKALVEAMRIVGIDFRDGILFVPEVLMAANAMKAGMNILRPLLAETGAPKIGKMVIGTVKGDIHDIGKNLVAMMMEGAGFEVINLGI